MDGCIEFVKVVILVVIIFGGLGLAFTLAFNLALDLADAIGNKLQRKLGRPKMVFTDVYGAELGVIRYGISGVDFVTSRSNDFQVPWEQIEKRCPEAYIALFPRAWAQSREVQAGVLAVKEACNEAGTL